MPGCVSSSEHHISYTIDHRKWRPLTSIDTRYSLKKKEGMNSPTLACTPSMSSSAIRLPTLVGNGVKVRYDKVHLLSAEPVTKKWLVERGVGVTSAVTPHVEVERVHYPAGATAWRFPLGGVMRGPPVLKLAVEERSLVTRGGAAPRLLELVDGLGRKLATKDEVGKLVQLRAKHSRTYST
jgi:hypothetical protein